MQGTETPQDRRAALTALAGQVADRAAEDRNFARAVGGLAEDLRAVADRLEQDPDLWRKTRAFHAVHVPSLTAIMGMLADIDTMVSISEEERNQLLASLNRASQLARAARETLERAALGAAKVELEVLADYAPEPEAPYQPPSRWTRNIDGLASLSERSWGGIKAGAASVTDLAGQSVSGLGTRAAAVPRLAANLQTMVTGMATDTIATPVRVRLEAGSKAVSSGAGAGIGLGVVAAALFPPLLPISAGGAVLVAMRSWRTELEAAQTLAAEERAARIEALAAERKAALRQLTHGADSLQMETEDLSLTLDIETGEGDAVILQGDHAGKTWSSLAAVERDVLKAQLVINGAGTVVSLLETLFEGPA